MVGKMNAFQHVPDLPVRRATLSKGFFSPMVLMTATIVASSVGSAAGQDKAADLERCMTIADSAARLRCFEEATSGKAPPQPQPNAQNTGHWKLMRTPDQRGGADAIAITHTADTSHSDLDLAGLMLRCAEKGIEALVVIVEPRPPRARPQVKISAGGDTASFSASIVPPFSLLLLPNDAAALLTGPWQSRSEIAFQIDGEGAPVRGVVPLAGLPSALQSLRTSCP